MTAATMDKPTNQKRRGKKTGRPRTPKPSAIIGGIDPHHAYPVHEFLVIARMTRQTFSRIRRQENGLIVRDAGVPTVLGQDWLDFVARQQPHVAKQRRPPKAETTEQTSDEADSSSAD
jgi:hypothetical protein